MNRGNEGGLHGCRIACYKASPAALLYSKLLAIQPTLKYNSFLPTLDAKANAHLAHERRKLSTCLMAFVHSIEMKN